MRTFNSIALTPFPDMSVKTGLHGAGTVKVAKIENHKGLVELKVVFDCPKLGLRRGESVWVRANTYTNPLAREIHTIGEDQFILLPESYVEVTSARLNPALLAVKDDA